MQTHPFLQTLRTIWILGVSFVLLAFRASAQNPPLQEAPVKTVSSPPVAVIETDLDEGEFMPTSSPGLAPQPERPAKVSLKPDTPLPVVSLKEEQVIDLNRILKNAIEQNTLLNQEKNEIDEELKFLRGQRRIEQNRVKAMFEEMRKVREQTDAIVDLNERYSRQVVDLQATVKNKEAEYKLKIKELEEKIVAMEEMPELTTAALRADKGQPTVDVDVVAMVEQFNQESEKLREDTARVHYNMGNLYFHKGQYQKAAKEYKKVLQLVPSDAEAHFNLAFVSGEYLEDVHTALRHYREYLLLKPDAEDAGLVQEKILEANLKVKSIINSPLDFLNR